MTRPLPDWAAWPQDALDYTLGVEEEVMLLDPVDWSLAHEIERVLDSLAPELGAHVTAETHKSALELRTGAHSDVGSLVAELRSLRADLDEQLRALDLRAAAAGTHPFAVWQQTEVSTYERHQHVYGSMRELARREPTFALHVHVGVSSPSAAIELYNRLRAHVPLLLALSVNSPLWQGRDTGLASARTPLFQAFPRVGIPRLFRDYRQWAEAVDVLLRSEAVGDPTFLWWDVRPQPRLGTVELRIADAQSTTRDTAALVALVQALARLELSEGYVDQALLAMPEVLDENRFIAARDGMDARLIDPILERQVPARVQLAELFAACVPHARELGSSHELSTVPALAERTGARRQLDACAAADDLAEVVAGLADVFVDTGQRAPVRARGLARTAPPTTRSSPSARKARSQPSGAPRSSRTW